MNGSRFRWRAVAPKQTFPLRTRTNYLHPRLAALGVSIPDEMPAQLARLAADETAPS